MFSAGSGGIPPGAIQQSGCEFQLLNADELNQRASSHENRWHLDERISLKSFFSSKLFQRISSKTPNRNLLLQRSAERISRALQSSSSNRCVVWSLPTRQCRVQFVNFKQTILSFEYSLGRRLSSRESLLESP